MVDVAVLQTVLSGVLSGGGTAVTAFAATFRDLKKRLTKLEERVGNDGEDGDPKTGLYIVVERLDEIARKVKKQVDSWEDDPPEWLLRLVNKAARNSSVNLENQSEQERILEGRFRTSSSNIRNVEERVENLTRALSNYIDRAEYEKDARTRSEELSSIREQLATVNGLLRGIMAAMGYIDPTKKKS